MSLKKNDEIYYLNPQTKKYIQRSINNVLRGKRSQWWQAS